MSTRTAPEQKPGRSQQDYETPPELITAVKRLLGIEEFAVDLAATASNAKAHHIYTVEGNALACDWVEAGWADRGWCWLNPPYANIAPWAQKCAESRPAKIALLVPASVGSNWFRDYVKPFATVLAMNGRVSFDGKGPYPKDTMVCLYGPGHLPGFHVWNWRAQP